MAEQFTNLDDETVVVKTEEELEKENQLPGYELFGDIMNSLNFKNKHCFLENPEAARKAYQPYVLNLCFSYVDKYGQNDSILFANEMNIRPDLDARLQYDFYFHGLSKRGRFGKGAHPDEINNLEMVAEYYNYSLKKAKEIISVLTPDQIEIIKNRMSKGEIKNDKPKRGKKSK